MFLCLVTRVWRLQWMLCQLQVQMMWDSDRPVCLPELWLVWHWDLINQQSRQFPAPGCFSLWKSSIKSLTWFLLIGDTRCTWVSEEETRGLFMFACPCPITSLSLHFATVDEPLSAEKNPFPWLLGSGHSHWDLLRQKIKESMVSFAAKQENSPLSRVLRCSTLRTEPRWWEVQCWEG